MGSYLRIPGNEIVSDREGISAAYRGLSSKNLPEAENRGFGIKTSKRLLIEVLGGQYLMLSGGSLYLKNPNMESFYVMPNGLRWNGTIVAFRIPYNSSSFNYLNILSNMRTIVIAEMFSPDLKSRMRAQDLRALLMNSEEKVFVFDFHGVKFATRSFIDKFYNLFLKNPGENPFSLEMVDVPEDIKAMMDAVSHTQVKAHVIPSQSPEISFKDVNEFLG